jgi:hypothetical protein
MRKKRQKVIEKDIKLDPICSETLLNYYTQGGGEVDQVKHALGAEILKTLLTISHNALQIREKQAY